MVETSSQKVGMANKKPTDLPVVELCLTDPVLNTDGQNQFVAGIDPH
jgi:hypothetical protein